MPVRRRRSSQSARCCLRVAAVMTAGTRPRPRTPVDGQALAVLNGSVSGRVVSVTASGALARCRRRGAGHVVARQLPRVPKLADLIQRSDCGLHSRGLHCRSLQRPALTSARVTTPSTRPVERSPTVPPTARSQSFPASALRRHAHVHGLTPMRRGAQCLGPEPRAQRRSRMSERHREVFAMLTLRKAAGTRPYRSRLAEQLSHVFLRRLSRPEHMGFRALRVLNDDRVAAGKGFGAHGHRDMEILSYVLEGGLAHKDSMGEQHVLGPNEVQAMSAGLGRDSQRVQRLGDVADALSPDLDRASGRGSEALVSAVRLPLVREARGAAADRRTRQDGHAAGGLHQSGCADVRGSARLPATRSTTRFVPGRHAWVQCATGAIDVNGLALKEGDGLAVSDESALRLRGSNGGDSELLLFDLA